MSETTELRRGRLLRSVALASSFICPTDGGDCR